MADPAPNNLRMPSKPEMVEETIARFDTAGVRSQLLTLDGPTLRGLGLLLADANVTIQEAYRWLEKESGGTEEEPAYDDNAVYRFATHFRRIYAQVRRERANRIARLSVDSVTAGDVDAMHRVSQARLAELFAEQLVATDTLDELRPAEVSAAITAITNHQAKKLQSDLETADLKRKELEDSLKTADLKRQELGQKLGGVAAKIKALADKLELTEKRREAGKKIDPAVYTSIRQELAAMAVEHANAATQELTANG
jgi:DNA-directed RNA polymerase subunit F